ncbi:MlaD family protein [Avrilella dinanensis]|uniref:MlaD family protein n=1 Tax=Avrilella dinanensis TaxID=2008672 RepID=UPI0013FDE076|nr:MlaD family protein [Avrilella dinanensis]
MKITKEIKTALLVLGSLAILIWGYNFLKGKDLFGNNRIFYVTYENVEGLTQASTVTLNGMVVGKVNKISIGDNAKIVVEISINNPIDIPASTVAEIYSPGMLGGKQIGLIVDYSDTNLAKNGDYLVSGIKLGIVDGLSGKADPIMIKLDSVLYNVNKLVVGLNNTLDDDLKNSLHNSLAELNQTLKNATQITSGFNRIVGDNEQKIGTIVSDFEQTSGNLKTMSDQLAQADLKSTLDKFEQTAESLSAMMAKIDNGEGNLGKLINDEQLYNNLEGTSKELNQLIEDIKLNPKRYIHISVFGKNPGPYEEPKK